MAAIQEGELTETDGKFAWFYSLANVASLNDG
jgi:hypothetical protein